MEHAPPYSVPHKKDRGSSINYPLILCEVVVVGGRERAVLYLIRFSGLFGGSSEMSDHFTDLNGAGGG